MKLFASLEIQGIPGRIAGRAGQNRSSIRIPIAASLDPMKRFLPLLALLLTNCGGGFGGTSVSKSPAVLNVSGWDPKERQRGGEEYSEHDVSALRRNGGQGLIARSAKGNLLDDKFPAFLASASRAGLMVGAYHFVTMSPDPETQADAFTSRVSAVARAQGIPRQKILLVGDFDTKSSPDRLVRFIRRVRQRTGVTPIVYLENSDQLRASLSHASAAQKEEIRQAPYWLALYGPSGTERTMFSSRPLTPDGLMKKYDIWHDWSMWQYGGVEWEGGRSRAKYYHTSDWSSPAYFGDLAQPMERSVFKGEPEELKVFWDQHGWAGW
jgi:GH25 family lysozyme M1 (1,4-beta-N-acetylmuramidase)